MLSTAESVSVAPAVPFVTERRLESREPLRCDLWMVDHNGATILRCRCLDLSENGMCLRAPLGYGVAEGQRYEIRSSLPGSAVPHTFGLIGRRWATVVRTRLVVGSGEDHLEVGVVLDPADGVVRQPALSAANV